MTSSDASPVPTPEGTVTSSGAGARHRTVLVAAVVVAAAAGLALGLLLAGGVLRPAAPGESSVEAGFARDMQVHHGQAVQMAVLVRDRSDDPLVHQLALDIQLTQQQQQGQMFGWLAVWGLPQTGTAPPMAWAAGHGHDATEPDGTMPGLVTPEQMTRLADADGEEADRLFLALMIPHHQGGVEMARDVLGLTDHPAVVRLAEAVVEAQVAEMQTLEQMLVERGGAPEDL